MFLFSANSAFLRATVVGSTLFLTSSGITHAFLSPEASLFAMSRTLQRFPHIPTNPATTDVPPGYRPALLPHKMMIPCDDTAINILSTTQILSVDYQAAVSAVGTATSSSLSILRTVLTVLFGIVAAGGLLTFFTVNFVIPKAAEKLEEDTKRMKPELWAKYQGKLEEGETMEMRPDLLQELGEIMKPIVIADYERQAMGGSDAGSGGTGSDGGIVDVKVESLDDKTNEEKRAEGGGVDQWKD